MTVVDIRQPKVTSGRNWIKAIQPKIYWVYLTGPDAHKSLNAMSMLHNRIQPVEWTKDPNGKTTQILVRPTYKIGGIHWQLTPELHEWIDNLGYNYALERNWYNDRHGFYVGFLSKDAAMTFKLAWG